MSEVKTRLTFAKVIVQEAGISALKEFAHWKDLAITEKGAQDFVSEVDEATERFLRSKIQDHFADDGIVGEEYGRTNDLAGFSGYSIRLTERRTTFPACPLGVSSSRSLEIKK